MLSDQEIKYIIEKAEACISSRDFIQALNYYNQLNENVQQPFYFKRCGFCHRMMGSMDKAIDDYNEALKLDPDDGVTYWERGACYNDKPYQEKIIDEGKKKELLEKALKDYKSSIERIPTSEEAWLALIDIELCLFKFDDAISHYGTCKPYIDSREYKVIRSWYGCLSLTLSGDSIDQNDEKELNDFSIRLKWYHWAFFSIDILLKELEQKGFDNKKFERAKEIHQKFIEHFDDKPFAFD